MIIGSASSFLSKLWSIPVDPLAHGANIFAINALLWAEGKGGYLNIKEKKGGQVYMLKIECVGMVRSCPCARPLTVCVCV